MVCVTIVMLLLKNLTLVDLIITGEGCTDSQSIYGKVMYGVGTHAKKFGISCIGLSGSLGDGAEKIRFKPFFPFHQLKYRSIQAAKEYCL